jgi:hypothetical protein
MISNPFFLTNDNPLKAENKVRSNHDSFFFEINQNRIFSKSRIFLSLPALILL